MATGQAPSAEEIGSALTAFVTRSTGLEHGSIEVEYESGTAFIRGSVSRINQARAIEDLIRWHDKVDRVVSDLRVLPPRMALQTKR